MRWFNVLFPHASDEDELVALYSRKTTRGEFVIRTPVRTFRIRHVYEPQSFELAWANQAAPLGRFPAPYKAVQAVASHKTGDPHWEQCAIRLTDETRQVEAGRIRSHDIQLLGLLGPAMSEWNHA